MTKSDIKTLLRVAQSIRANKARRTDTDIYDTYISLSIQLSDALERSELSDDIKQIIYYRYTLAMQWIKLADICGSYSTDAIRKACDRALDKVLIQ